MDIETYRRWTHETAVYPEAVCATIRELNYLIFGMIGESGEIANKWKKSLRKKQARLDPLVPIDESLDYGMILDLADEVGDTLWYACRIIHVLGFDVAQVLIRNKDKLEERKISGELKDHAP